MHQKIEGLQKSVDVGQIVYFKNKSYEVLDIARDGDLILGNNEDVETEASPEDCF